MAIVLKDNNEIKAFNVSQHVGQGKANLWTDCMLVLYLLHRYGAYTLSNEDGIGTPAFDPGRDYNNIKIVGNAIRGFQTYCNTLGIPLKIDGKVHCPPNWSDNQRYTIGVLNVLYWSAAKKHFHEIPDYDPFDEALNDHRMPPLLRGQLVASYAFQGVI